MKQGTVITRVIMLIFFAAVLAYLGYSVFGAIYDPLTTTAAVACTAGESYNTMVWLVREERPVCSESYITSITRADGEKVAAGGVVAQGYRSDDIYDRQQELQELQERLDQLEYTYKEGEQLKLDPDTVKLLEERIDSGILALGRSSAQGELQAAGDQATSLRTLILRRSASDVDQSLLWSNIEDLKQEISQLEREVSVGTNYICVDYAGWFCSECDGYETILTPEALLNAGVSSFQQLIETEVTEPGNAVGRLVTDATWYAAALLPADYAAQLDELSAVQLDLNQNLSELITVQVESVSPSVDGQCLAVLSSNVQLDCVIGLRTVEAGLVLKLYEGIRVPKEAIRVGEDGRAGVYVIEGAKARFKPVTLLYDNGDSYVVEEDRSSTDNLWVGNEIIVSARNLYDGKVVK